MWSCFLAPAESRAFTTAPVASSIIIVSVSLSVYRYTAPWGFPGGANGKELAHQCKRQKRHGFDPWVRKIPWRRSWQPTPVFLPGESHGQGSLTSYSPWSCKESDTTEACTHLVQACSALSAPGWRLAASASSLHSALFAALCLSESHHGVLEGGSR